MQNQADQPVSLGDGGIILGSSVTMGVTGVIHMVKVNKGEFGLLFLDVGDGVLDGLDRPVAVFDHVDGLPLEQSSETVPIVKDRNLGRRPLSPQESEHRREDAR